MSFSSKQKAPKSKRNLEDGDVSFSTENIADESREEIVNAEAYEYIRKAMNTSSHVKTVDKDGENVEIDSVYPITRAECDEMSDLLNKAEKAAGNPDSPHFKSRLNEMREIVTWSKKRHWNFSKLTILGVIISTFFLHKTLSSSQTSSKEMAENVATVEAWEKGDTTLVLEKMRDNESEYHSSESFASPTIYKAYTANQYAEYYFKEIENLEFWQNKADEAPTMKEKNECIKKVKKFEGNATKYKEKFDKINGLEFDEVKKTALAEAKKRVEKETELSSLLHFWTYFLVLLIPLYIFAERPFGYTITRHRTEAKVLGGIRKFSYILATGAAAISFIPATYVKWSDGTTTAEGDGCNILILGIKLCLYAMAAVMICAVSCFLMTYSTIVGLCRNYNWQPIIAKVKATLAKKEREN